MKTVSALTLRKKMGEIIDEVAIKKEEIVISRDEKPLAVLIPYDQYEKEWQAKKKRIAETVAEMDRLYEKFGKKIKLKKNSTELIREMRDSR